MEFNMFYKNQLVEIVLEALARSVENNNMDISIIDDHIEQLVSEIKDLVTLQQELQAKIDSAYDTIATLVLEEDDD
jgi:hypothetical protein